MINFIYNKYGIKIDKMYSDNKNIYFFINNRKIYILNFQDINIDLIYLSNLCCELNDKYGFKINSFVYNKSKELYTKKDDYFVVLMQVNDFESYKTLNYIKKFEFINSKLKNYNIISEWGKEVDALEKELIGYNQEYPLIQKSIDYYIGRAENAIELLSNFKKIISNNNDSIGQMLDYELYNKNEINNPLNFIKVNRMYNMSNYIKWVYYTNQIDFKLIETIIKNTNEFEQCYLFACLLYPSEIFDLIKKIISNVEREEKINFYIKRISNYNQYLISIKKLMKTNSININWLNV